MDFMKIISHAWNLVKKNRSLWWLGLLAGSAEGASSRFGSSGGVDFSSLFKDSPNSSGDSSSFQSLPSHTADLMEKMPRVLGASTSREAESFSSWMSTNWPVVVIIGGIFILLAVLIIYISNSARAGLILSIDHSESGKKKLSFGEAFHSGEKYAWRLFGLNLLFGLIILAFFVVIAFPLFISLIVEAGVTTYILAGIFLFLGFLALIILSLYLHVANKFAARILVIHNTTIKESFRRARRLIQNQFKNSAFTWLIDIGIGIVVGLALAIGILVLLAILFGFGMIFYAIAQTTGAIVYSVIVGLAFIVLMFILGGIYTAFISSFWTLSYRAIDYLEKKSREK